MPTTTDCEKQQLNFIKQNQWQAETEEISTRNLEIEATIAWYRKLPIEEHLFCNFTLSITIDPLDSPER